MNDDKAFMCECCEKSPISTFVGGGAAGRVGLCSACNLRLCSKCAGSVCPSKHCPTCGQTDAGETCCADYVCAECAASETADDINPEMLRRLEKCAESFGQYIKHEDGLIVVMPKDHPMGLGLVVDCNRDHYEVHAIDVDADNFTTQDPERVCAFIKENM